MQELKNNQCQLEPHTLCHGQPMEFVQHWRDVVELSRPRHNTRCTAFCPGLPLPHNRKTVVRYFVSDVRVSAVVCVCVCVYRCAQVLQTGTGSGMSCRLSARVRRRLVALVGRRGRSRDRALPAPRDPVCSQSDVVARPPPARCA